MAGQSLLVLAVKLSSCGLDAYRAANGSAYTRHTEQESIRLGLRSPPLHWAMGTSHSRFNKANFKRGIRGYRQMFASLHLEQKELKKLWIEFGKIDTDNGGTVRTSARFTCRV